MMRRWDTLDLCYVDDSERALLHLVEDHKLEIHIVQSPLDPLVAFVARKETEKDHHVALINTLTFRDKEVVPILFQAH